MMDEGKVKDIRGRLMGRLQEWWIDVDSEEHRAVIDAVMLYVSRMSSEWFMEHESLTDDDRELAMFVSWFTKD